MINQCCQCKKDEETINHLILHCEYVADIWHLVLNSFGVSWVLVTFFSSSMVGNLLGVDILEKLFGKLFSLFLCGAFGKK
jgi:hypothetical protein